MILILSEELDIFTNKAYKKLREINAEARKKLKNLQSKLLINLINNYKTIL